MPFDPNANYIEESRLIKATRLLVVLISVVLFLISLPNTCFCAESRCRSSIEALLIGLFAAFDGSGFSWFANPLLLLTLILILKKSKYSLLFSLFATLLSLSFLGVNDVLANEGGAHEKIIKIAVGYWLWLSSCIITFIGSLTIIIMKWKLQ